MAADLIDLHTHTNCSDGDYAPAELLRLAKKRGVKTIAITDHDTVDGYDKELFLLAKELEIKLIPGIEFSTIDEESGQKIHALGLGIDSDNKALREELFPKNVLIVSIKRGSKEFIPNGNTVILPGDILTILCYKSELAEVKQMTLTL